MDSLDSVSQWGARISTHTRQGLGPTLPVYKWYWLCPVVQQPGCGADHPSTSSTEVIERAELYSYSASKPRQSSNWGGGGGTEICVKRKSPSPYLLAIPEFNRIAVLYDRHISSNTGICLR